MSKTILVPLDGSTLSERALPLACSIAQRSGATLRLVHVHMRHSANPLYVEGLPILDEDLHSLGREHERVYLQRTCTRLEAESDLTITCEILDGGGSIAIDLVRDAVASGADLVVMTTHGRGGLERAWLGSVADGLVRLSTVPILLLRQAEGALETDGGPNIEHVVIPLDGSGLAEQIIEPALALGTCMEAKYTLLHVVEPVTRFDHSPVTTTADASFRETEWRQRAAERYLDDVAQRLRAKGQQVATMVVHAPQPALAILEEARQRRNTVVAMATHGRSGLTRRLVGSIADKVLRGATMPVLLYRPGEEPEPREPASASG